MIEGPGPIRGVQPCHNAGGRVPRTRRPLRLHGGCRLRTAPAREIEAPAVRAKRVAAKYSLACCTRGNGARHSMNQPLPIARAAAHLLIVDSRHRAKGRAEADA